MRIRITVGERAEHIGWNAVKLFGLVVVIGALISSSSRGVVKPTPSAPSTVIPAQIRAAHVEAVSVPFGGRVVQVLVAPGATVKAGQLLAVLESDEVRQQMETTARRLAIAKMRVTPRVTKRKATAAEELQARTTKRALEAARRRFATDSTAEAEAAYASARSKREKLAGLVADRMATAAELDAAQREEQNELRNLKAAQEHHSRLEQEVESYETQLFVLTAQLEGAPASEDGAGLELAEAQAAADLAARNSASLRLTAPCDGVVLSSVPTVGDRVFAGAPIVQVADVSRLSFEAPVSAIIARQVRPGMTVRLRVPTEPPQRLDAEISSVALVPDPIQQSYVVRAVISNPDRNVILVGMEGAMEFPHGESLWRRLF